jgi:hypothetical protein
MYHFEMDHSFLAVPIALLPVSRFAARAWYELVGLFAFWMLLKLLGKFQAQPMMRRARINQFSALVGIIFLVALLKMGSDWHKLDLYKRKGVVTQASVTRKSWDTDILPIRNVRTRYIIAYEYTGATGAKHTGEQYVRSQIWNPLSVGGKVEVSYLSDSPADSAVNDWGGSYESMEVCIVLASLACPALWWAMKTPKTRRSL